MKKPISPFIYSLFSVFLSAFLFVACGTDESIGGDPDEPSIPSVSGYIELSEVGNMLSYAPINPVARSYVFTARTAHRADEFYVSVNAEKAPWMRGDVSEPSEPSTQNAWMHCTAERLDSVTFRITVDVEANNPWAVDESLTFFEYPSRNGQISFTYYHTPTDGSGQVQGFKSLHIEQHNRAVRIEENVNHLEPITAPLLGFSIDDRPEILQQSFLFTPVVADADLIYYTSKEDSTWLQLTDGAYDKQQLSIKENGRPAVRTGEVILGMRDLFGYVDSMAAIPVSQEGFSRIVPSSDNIAATNAGQTIELPVRSNCGRPTLTSSASWAKVDGVVRATNHPGDMDTIVYRITLGANGAGCRTATLTASAGNVKQSFSLRQYDSKTRFVHLHGGQSLSAHFTTDEMFDIERLVVSGEIAESDFRTIRDGMTTIQEVDLAGTTLDFLPDLAFVNRASIKRVVLPSGLKGIGYDAFGRCAGLEEVNIPAGVTEIRSGAFDGCERLKQIALPTGLTAIESSTFSGCKALTSIRIPEGVTTIGSSAFSECVGLTEIVLPKSLKMLGKSPSAYPASEHNGTVFMECSNLKKVVFQSEITMIPERCFCLCEKLTDIDLSKVTTVGYGAFYKCISLKKVELPRVCSIYDSAFKGCSGLTAISLPTSLTTIQREIFKDCRSLASVSLPKSLTSLTSSMFEGCTALAKIDIPASVLSLGDAAFQDCASLSTILYRGTTVPSMGSQVFRSIASPATLYVPAGAVAAFRADEQWGGIGEVKAL